MPKKLQSLSKSFISNLVVSKNFTFFMETKYSHPNTRSSTFKMMNTVSWVGLQQDDCLIWNCEIWGGPTEIGTGDDGLKLLADSKAL